MSNEPSKPLSNFDLVEPLNQMAPFGYRNVNTEFKKMVENNEVWFTREKLPLEAIIYVKPSGNTPEYTGVRKLYVGRYTPSGRAVRLDEGVVGNTFWVDTISFSKFWDLIDYEIKPSNE